MIKLGCVTFNILKEWDVETIIAKLAEAGFEGVELRTGHAHGVEPSISADERAKVRKQFENSSVKLVAYGTTCEFHSPDAESRARQVQLAKEFVDLAVDTGALGIKVRPNNLPPEVPIETTIANIGVALREVGEYAAEHGIKVWMEVHGRETQNPPIAAQILQAASHPNVLACWNCNPTDITNGSIRESFQLLWRWIGHVHMHDLTDDYPYKELFALLKEMGYDGYMFCESPASCEPERFLRYYKALWTELNC